MMAVLKSLFLFLASGAGTLLFCSMLMLAQSIQQAAAMPKKSLILSILFDGLSACGGRARGLSSLWATGLLFSVPVASGTDKCGLHDGLAMPG